MIFLTTGADDLAVRRDFIAEQGISVLDDWQLALQDLQAYTDGAEAIFFHPDIFELVDAELVQAM